MVVYACCCLNVSIYGEKPAEQRAEADALESCPLGSSFEVIELVDQGFQFIHKCLIHRIKEGEWTVYECVPCHMRTHAVNHSARLVAISSDLKKGEEAIKGMKTKSEFSSVFHLLLNPKEWKLRDDDIIQPQSYETLQKQLGELQNVLSMYLKQEEEAMERRIRNYEEEQRNKFDKLKEKAQKEKTALISALFHNSEGNHSMMAADRGQSRNHAPLSHSRSATEYSRPVPNNPIRERERNNRRIRDSSPDVFAMDELEIADEEAEEDNHTPSNRSDNRLRFENTNNSNVEQSGRVREFGLDDTDEGGNDRSETAFMSTSVPISMPASTRNLRNRSRLDDDIEESAEFDDIPRNMQALSESIQEHDRYIFGDRPRQRVHTGDFTQVKWH